MYICDLVAIPGGHAVCLPRAGMNHGAERSVEVALSPAGAETDDAELPLKEAREQFEWQYVTRVLHRVQWNISRAARVLRVHRNTILRKLSAWDVKRPGGEPGGASS